ncbi:hypothetical protein CCYA_CCYA01G0274 [Cyanidiococcus yangmingshanensis]|nr:hypothetical protein CCYA_CCYA01G0274 [Cyanidiococcus yangmingshanensis]
MVPLSSAIGFAFGSRGVKSRSLHSKQTVPSVSRTRGKHTAVFPLARSRHKRESFRRDTWLSSKESRESSRKTNCSEEGEKKRLVSDSVSSTDKAHREGKGAADTAVGSIEKAVLSQGEREDRRHTDGEPEDMLARLQADLPVIRQIFGADTFFPTEDVVGKRGVIYRGNLRSNPEEVYQRLTKRLQALLGETYVLSLLEGDETGRAFVLIEPNRSGSRAVNATFKISWLKREEALTFVVALMFCALTAITVFIRVGTILGPEYGDLRRVTFANGLKPFYLGVFLSMSLAQSLQRLIAWRHRCSISPPIMLPSPQLGTFGSVYHLDESPPDRTALFDIAMAGGGLPFILSIIVFVIGAILTSLAVGLPLSSVAHSMTNVHNYVYVPVHWIYHDSFLLGMIARAFLHVQPVPQEISASVGQNFSPLVLVHPLLLVGANLVQISALSLLPLRQLDGWRILAAIFGRRAAGLLSRLTVLFLLLGAARYPHLLLYLAVILFGPWKVDRQCRNEVSEPNNVRLVFGYLVIVLMIFAMCPFSQR